MTDEQFHKLIEGKADVTWSGDIEAEANSAPVIDFVQRLLREAVTDSADEIVIERSHASSLICFVRGEQRYEMPPRSPLVGQLVSARLRSIARGGRLRTDSVQFRLSSTRDGATEVTLLRRV
jgi:hypothetical protein